MISIPNINGKTKKWQPVTTNQFLYFPSSYLVGGWFTPLKNISQLGWLFPILMGKQKNGNQSPPTSSSIFQAVIWLVVGLPLWKILVNWDDYSQY